MEGLEEVGGVEEEDLEAGEEEGPGAGGEVEDGGAGAPSSRRVGLTTPASAQRSRSSSRVCPRGPRCPSWSNISPQWARSRWTG